MWESDAHSYTTYIMIFTNDYEHQHIDLLTPKILILEIAGEEKSYEHRSLLYMAASASAEFFADIAYCPLEAVKVRIQTSGFCEIIEDSSKNFRVNNISQITPKRCESVSRKCIERKD